MSKASSTVLPKICVHEWQSPRQQYPINFSADLKGLSRRNRLSKEKQLKLHLNNEEIDELLQSTTGDGPVKSANPGHLEEARRHLKDCAICQILMREHEHAIEGLTLLKPISPGTKGPICPPDYIWLDIAAGILDRDAENDLSHAAECDHCGPLLRQAKEDFANEVTPEEETTIANLPSSTIAWQGRLAAKLQDAQAPITVLPSPKDRSPSFVRSLLAPWRLTVAAAIIGLILLGLRDHRQTADLITQNQQATAEIQQLKQSILQQNGQIAQLAAESKRSSSLAPVPEPQPTDHMQIASLVLDPGLTRGIASLKHLTIPAGTNFAKITLRLPENPDGVVREELVTADGQKKWSQELRPPEPEKNTNSLSLLLPVYLLIPNDYQIVLSRKTSDGFERFATYTFRVTR